MTRRARALVAVLAAVMAAAAVPATSSARAPFNAHLSCPKGHHPRVDKPWPIVITARSWGGKPLSGRVRYQYLYGGKVVAHRSNYRFSNGRFKDTLIWPARSKGIPLTFRAVVTTRLGKVNLDYAVRVR